jgi:hypothetical protein
MARKRWEKCGAEGNKNFFYFSIFNEGVLCQCTQAPRHDMKGAMMIQTLKKHHIA